MNNRLESQFGIDGGASSWLRSYLSDRQEFVIIHLAQCSAPLEFTKGQCSYHCSSQRMCHWSESSSSLMASHMILLSRQGDSEGVQLPYTCPESRAHSANWRLGSNSSVQYRRFQVGLL